MAIHHLADRYGVAVIGGDTAIVPARTTVDVVLIGEVPKGKAILRSGAKAGDQIFVSGRLGCSALGLRLLKKGTRRGAPWAQTAFQAHLRPEPRCALGQFLATRGLASALIDISDGLSTDLARLCQASKVGARIREASLPVPAIGLRRPAGLELLQLALHGGEDYELLFTVPPGKVRQIPTEFRGVPLHCIGVVESSKPIYLVRPNGAAKVLKPSGFDHFQKSTG
jgi:thiamine-monophosphate kinase